MTAGTSNEVTIGGNQVTITQPILLRSGEYQLLGLVGGDSGVIQSFSVSDEVSQE